MKAHTLDEQFLSELLPEQKGIIWDYFRLITKNGELLDYEIDRISNIWELAEKDDQLLKWLEFIDYLYTNVDEADLPSEEKRAYLSEYLVAETGKAQETNNSFIVRVLKCPDSNDEVLILWNEKEQGATDSPCFFNHICSNCKRKYAEHTPVEGRAIIPKP